MSPRDRSIATVAVLIALYRPEELSFHLRVARDNGVTRDELAALITHIAFYAGFPAAMSSLEGRSHTAVISPDDLDVRVAGLAVVNR